MSDETRLAVYHFGDAGRSRIEVVRVDMNGVVTINPNATIVELSDAIRQLAPLAAKAAAPTPRTER